MPSSHILAQCLAEPKRPHVGAEVLFMICPSLLRHPQLLLLGTLSQGNHLLGPTPLTPTSNKDFLLCFPFNYETLFKRIALRCSEGKKGMDFGLGLGSITF